MNCLYCNDTLHLSFSKGYYCPKTNYHSNDSHFFSTRSYNGGNHALVYLDKNKLSFFNLALHINNQNYRARGDRTQDYFYIHSFSKSENKLIVELPFPTLDSYQEIPTLVKRYLNMKIFL